MSVRPESVCNDMGAQSLPPNSQLVSPDRSLAGEGRLLAARVTGMLGLGAYNWWIATFFVPGMLRSPDGFFSDLSADGQPHAAMLHRVDTIGGLLLVAALLLRGPLDGLTKRPEWPWLVAFAVVAAIGGMFPYACAPGYDAACRRLQYGFDLPLHHYVHMVSGVAEFFTATMAIWVARHTDPEGHRLPGRLGHVLIPLLVVAYPLLAYAYLRDRGGSLIEPVFFIIFSLFVAAELSGPGTRTGEVAPGDASQATARLSTQ
jgi:Protein of unknown function (DUF998)